MSLRLALLSLVFPRGLKRRMLDELARVTADGFEVAVPAWNASSFQTRLDAYARFTAGEAGLLLEAGDAAAIQAAKGRLRRGAAGLGAGVRRRLGLRGPEEAFAAWRLLYRQIGIDVTGSPVEGVAVTRCHFAGYYSERVCGVIAALDEGLADGLFGGATLDFSERLTAGALCCRAELRLEGRRS